MQQFQRASLLSLLTTLPLWLCACPVGPELSTPPDGFEPAHGWSVLVGAEPALSHPTSSAPLLDPRGIAVIDGERGPALWVLESGAWRVRRMPILSVDPIEVGEAETAFMFGGETGRAHAAAAFGPTSSKPLFALAADGAMWISGPQREPYLVTPDGAAHPLGRRNGLALADGRGLGEVDLSHVVAVELSLERDGALELLMVSGQRVWQVQVVDRVHPEFSLIRHIAGSGASGDSETGVQARLAPLDFGGGGSIAVDSTGNLFVSTRRGGRLWAIANYREEGALMQLLAGGGTALCSKEPLTDQLLEPAGLGFALVEEGSERSLYFVNGKRPMRLSFDFAGGLASNLVLSVAADRSYPLCGGLAMLGNHLLVADAEAGTVAAHLPDHEGLAADVVAGPRDLGDGSVAPLIPTPLRPSGVLTTTFNDTEMVLFHDAGGGSVNLVTLDSHPEIQPVIQRTAGTRFPGFYFMGMVPATEWSPELVLVASETKLAAVQVGTGRSIQMTRGSNGTASVDGSPLSGLYPQTPPDLLGVASDGALVFVADGMLLGAHPTDDVLSYEAEIDILAGAGEQLPTPGLGVGLNVLALANLGSATLGTSDVVTVVLHEEVQGDLVVLATLPSWSAATVAGHELRSRSATLVLGGGFERIEDGRLGSEIGLRGVTAAVVVGERVLVAVGDSEGGSRLAEISNDGTFAWLTDPTAPSLSSPDETDLADLHFSSPVSHLDVLPCLGESVVVVHTPRETWLVNVGVDDASSPGGGSLGPARAIALSEDAVVAVACRRGEVVVLNNVEGAATLTNFDGWELDTPSAVDVVAEGDSLIISLETDSGGELAVIAEDEGTVTPLTGLSGSSLDGRELWRGRLPDQRAVFAASAEPALLFAALEGELVAIHPVEGAGYGLTSRLETVWSGPPFVGSPEALLVESQVGSELTLLLAVEGQVHRLTIPIPRGGPFEGNVGESHPVAGGGSDYPGLGARALDANLRAIHGIVLDRTGRLWLRWDRYVGYLDGRGRLIAIAGGGTKAPNEAHVPWNLALPATASTHPDLAITSTGRVITSDASRGLIIALTP